MLKAPAESTPAGSYIAYEGAKQPSLFKFKSTRPIDDFKGPKTSEGLSHFTGLSLTGPKPRKKVSTRRASSGKSKEFTGSTEGHKHDHENALRPERYKGFLKAV